MKNFEKYYDKLADAICFSCQAAKLRGINTTACMHNKKNCKKCKKESKEWLLSTRPPQLFPGMYIVYDMKNELGKVKRVCNDGRQSVFAWFHAGDTAARINASQFTVVMTAEEADEAEKRGELKAILHSYNFSNDYAIDVIMSKDCRKQQRIESITKELKQAVQEGYLQKDPKCLGNILLYRKAGVNSPEGWYSESIDFVAEELADDEEQYISFKGAIEKSKNRKEETV